jgi:hypothetical protein
VISSATSPPTVVMLQGAHHIHCVEEFTGLVINAKSMARTGSRELCDSGGQGRERENQRIPCFLAKRSNDAAPSSAGH